MNSDPASSWPQTEQPDQMVSMTGMDFSSLLDLGDFNDVDLSQYPGGLDQDQSQTVQQPPNTPYNAGMQSSHSAYDFAAEHYQIPMDISQEAQTQPNSHNGSNTDLHGYGMNAAQQNWDGQLGQTSQQFQEPVYMPRHQIPPTPNSYEMHGGDMARFMPHQQQRQMDPETQAYLQQAYQMKKDSFTPLVSPAVTPQDSQFQTLSEYAVPGAYFSPLTSPALLAQNAAREQRRPASRQTQPSTAGSSVATSPVNANFDFDMATMGSMALPEPARRSKRKTQAPRSTGPTGRVRQSPIVKPLKRKSATLSSAIPPKELESILRDSIASQKALAAAGHTNATMTDSSAHDSISPEASSEASMGPPPKPSSAQQSPAILGQSHPTTGSAAPATPASLMSIERAKQQKSSQGHSHLSRSVQPSPMASDDGLALDEFALPPSAKPVRPAVQSAPIAPADVTPRIQARRTPKLGRLSTASSSPMIGAVNTTPKSASGPGSGRPFDGKSGTPVSSMVSPALRPKISPSIKPLLPDGASLNDSQHALLLASKSNYTHLLEGTMLPGVSYPESLSSGLTSKRTSHKLAEQGRRNRINEALKEMQALLPTPVSKPEVSPTNGNAGADADEAGTGGAAGKGGIAGAGGSDGSSKQPQSKAQCAAAAAAASEAKAANSKAATVESAIDYIKVLQRQQMAMEHMFRGKDEEIASLRRRLMDAGLNGAGAGDAGSKAEGNADAGADAGPAASANA